MRVKKILKWSLLKIESEEPHGSNRSTPPTHDGHAVQDVVLVTQVVEQKGPFTQPLQVPVTELTVQLAPLLLAQLPLAL